MDNFTDNTGVDLSIKDDVNHPDHYTQGGMETIEAIKGMLTPEEYRGYLRDNILKYLWRYRMKGGAKDLRKLNVYLGWLYQHERTQPNDGQDTVSSK